MNDSLSKQENFQGAFGQPVLKLGDNPEKDRRILRLKLALEELGELAEGMGMSYDYVDLLTAHQKSILDADKNKNTKYDKIAVLDALADIQVIHNGTILECGMAEIFDEAYDAVHESNMSKVCTSQEEAEQTVDYYTEKGNEGELDIKPMGVGDTEYFIVQRTDGKALKSINYTPVNLKPLL